MKRYLGFLFAAGMLAGCATSSPPSAEEQAPVRPAAGPRRDRLAELKQGMGGDEVVAIFGQPEKRSPSVEVKGGEVWTYHEIVGVVEGHVPIAAREVPYIDPFTGMTKMIQETVFGVETTKTIRFVSLMLIDGRLHQWLAREEKSRSIL